MKRRAFEMLLIRNWPNWASSCRKRSRRTRDSKQSWYSMQWVSVCAYSLLSGVEKHNFNMLTPPSCNVQEWRMWRCCRRSWYRCRRWWTVWAVRGKRSLNALKATMSSCRLISQTQRWGGNSSSRSLHLHVFACDFRMFTAICMH